MPAPDHDESERERLRTRAVELRRELLKRFGEGDDDWAWQGESRPAGPAVAPAATASRVDRAMETHRLGLTEDRPTSSSPVAPSPATPPRPTREQELVRRSKSFGLADIISRLFEADPDGLERGIRRLEALIEVWGPNRPQSRDEASLKLVLERRDEAALYASSVFYGLAYRAGLPGTTVWEVAEKVAFALNAEMYRGVQRLQPIRESKFDHAKHQCSTSIPMGGRVRPVTFQIVSAESSDRIERKALVEVLPTGGST